MFEICLPEPTAHWAFFPLCWTHCFLLSVFCRNYVLSPTNILIWLFSEVLFLFLNLIKVGLNYLQERLRFLFLLHSSEFRSRRNCCLLWTSNHSDTVDLLSFLLWKWKYLFMSPISKTKQVCSLSNFLEGSYIEFTVFFVKYLLLILMTSM